MKITADTSSRRSNDARELLLTNLCRISVEAGLVLTYGELVVVPTVMESPHMRDTKTYGLNAMVRLEECGTEIGEAVSEAITFSRDIQFREHSVHDLAGEVFRRQCAEVASALAPKLSLVYSLIDTPYPLLDYYQRAGYPHPLEEFGYSHEHTMILRNHAYQRQQQ